MSIRLSKALRELNIGLETAMKFFKYRKELGEVLPEPSFKLNDTQFTELEKEFNHIPGEMFAETVEKKDEQSIGKHFESLINTNVYVIDTNVFMYCPNIINYIDEKNTIVLSAKVIDELDGLKGSSNSGKKNSAQKALRNINTCFSQRNIKMETADTNLLSIDLNPKSPDNQILSVALRHKVNNDKPILLTSDIGLQIKAKGLGINVVSLVEFLH